MSGDGLADLLVDGHVALAPVSGQIVADEHPAYDGIPMDLDGDGAAEQVRRIYATETLEVRAAVPSAWDEAPLLTLDPSCAWPEDPSGYSTWYESPSVGRLVPIPDLDGDGVRELWFQGLEQDGVYDLPCRDFLFPADVRGVYDPLADAARVPLPYPIPDQSGDGLADLIDWDTGEIRVGPFTWAGDALVGTATIVPAWDYPWVPLGVDLTGDGMSEWLSSVVYAGGASGGLTTGEPLLVDHPSGERFADRDAWTVEDGVAAVLTVDGDVLVGIDVGPASRAP